MKRVLVLACIVVALPVAALIWSGRQVPGKLAADNPATIAPPTTTPSTQSVVGVEDLMKHVDQYAGPLVVEGVVIATSANSQLLSLVDRQEFEECGVAGCTAYVLPVRWGGTMPAVKNIVRVKGEVKQAEGGKRAFIASAVEDIKAAVEGKEEGNE